MSNLPTKITGSPLARRVLGWLLMGLTPVVVLALWLVGTTVSSEDQKLRHVSQMAAQHNLEMLDRLLFERYGNIQTLADLPALRQDPACLTSIRIEGPSVLIVAEHPSGSQPAWTAL